MSPHEMEHFNAISGTLACMLAECGFAEAARACERTNPSVATMLARLNRWLP